MKTERFLNILLIEEDAQVAHSLTEVLKSLKQYRCDVTSIPHLVELHCLDASQKYDLLLVSQHLLMMSDTEQLGALRSHAPNAPLLALTQLNEKFSGDLCKKHEVDGYLLREYLDVALIEKTITTGLERHKLWGRHENPSETVYPLYDANTQLPSLSLFLDRLDQSIAHHHRYKRQCALLLFSFKSELLDSIISDTEKSEKLLRQISKKLKASVNASDTLVSFPNFKFGVLLNELPSLDEAGKNSQIMLRVLSEPYLIEKDPLFLQPAVGICAYPLDALDATQMIDFAEQALTQAEQEPNFTYFFNFQTQKEFYKQLKLERDLRLAWVRGEFEVQHQPQVNTQTEEFYGLEASLQWKDHPPEEFGSFQNLENMLEDTGLALPLSDWLLRVTCRQFQMWREEEPKLCLTLRLPIQQILQNNFSSKLKEQLEQHHIPPQQWILSIPEFNLLQHLEAIQPQLIELKKTGVTLMVCDAGQEHSKILLLQSLPIDRIALHANFFKQHKKNPDLIQSLVLVAKSMRKSIMACNIEDQNTQQMASSSGFNLAQGEYFGSPVAAAQAQRWFGAVWK